MEPEYQFELETNSIIKNEKYNTILIPLHNYNKIVNKNIAIIYPNVLSILNYKHVIDNIITNIEPTYNIHLYKLFHFNRDNLENENENYNNENNIIYKKYDIKSGSYNSELIDIWVSNDDSNEEIDFLKDEIKKTNFELTFTSILFDDAIDDVLIFGHSNMIYDYNLKTENMIYNKKVIYVSFDILNDNKYDIFIDNKFIENNIIINLETYIASIITNSLTIMLPPRFKISNIEGNDILDVYKDQPMIIIYNDTIKYIEDVNNTKYFCIVMHSKRDKYYYRFNENLFIELNDASKVDGILKNSIEEINLIGIYNLINYTDTDYLLDIIDELQSIIDIKIIQDNKKLLKLYNKILKKYSELLTLKKNNYIDNNKLIIKTDKFNVLELLQTFVHSEPFNFYDVKKLNKQNKNIIKNYSSISTCQNEIILWEIRFNEYMNSVNENDIVYKNSSEIYNLLLSRTSWYDELQNGNILGLLVNIVTPKLAKLGIIMDKVKIMEISNNLITLETLCEAQDIYKSDRNKYDDGRNDKSAIYGNALGNGNCILPLYINNMHWKLAKLQLKYCLGIAVNQNPFAYYNKYFELYPMLLLKLIRTMISDRNKITDKDIVTFIQLTITVNKILEEIFKFSINKYSLEELSNIFIEPSNRSDKSFENLDFILGLTLLSNNKKFSKHINNFKNNNLKNIFAEELRRNCKNNYKTHLPFDKSYLDVINLWTHYFKIKPLDDSESNNELIIEILNDEYNKHTKKIPNHDENIPLIFNDTIIDQNIIDSINKIMCWSIINDINNNETIDNLNKVVNNKYGNITDDTIKYFKNKFIDLNKKFSDLNNNDNKLLFLNIENNHKFRLHTFILQNINIRNKKYFDDNYIFCSLYDDIKDVKMYYVMLTHSYINIFYEGLSKAKEFKLLYTHKIISLLGHINDECTNYYNNVKNNVNIYYPLFNNNISNDINRFNNWSISQSIIENIDIMKNTHISNNNKIIIDALLNNRNELDDEIKLVKNELILRGINI